MADQVDVENALVGVIAGALYPNGTSQPSRAGVHVKVSRGWPNPADFEAAKAEGFCLASVATRNGVERNTTRYPREFDHELSRVPRTLSAAVGGNAFTLAGTISTPQNVLVLCSLFGDAVAYAVQPGDTLASIAAALATLLAPGYPGTTSHGATVMVGGAPERLEVRIATAGTTARELRRQDKSFQVSVWAPPHPDAAQDADAWRTALVRVIDPALAALRLLSLGDGSDGFPRYERTIVFDLAQEEGLYRRDLFYWVEYPTIVTSPAFEIGVFTAVNTGGIAGSPPVRTSY